MSQGESPNNPWVDHDHDDPGIFYTDFPKQKNMDDHGDAETWPKRGPWDRLGPRAQPVKVLGDTSQFSMLQTTFTLDPIDMDR